MMEENSGSNAGIPAAVQDNSPKNFLTSTSKRPYNEVPADSQHITESPEQIQEIISKLPGVFRQLQHQQDQLPYRDGGRSPNTSGQYPLDQLQFRDSSRPRSTPGQYPLDQLSASGQETINQSQTLHSSARRTSPGINLGSDLREPFNRHTLESYGDQTPGRWGQTTMPGNRYHWDGGGGGQATDQHKEPPAPKIAKERKSITTKTFAKGMMDISLLTSNATQLRAIMANPDHEFYRLLIWLIAVSVVLQILSSVLLIMSDFYKTQVKEVDRQNQRKRKALNFISLALISIVTSLNVLISAFYAPGMGFNKSSSQVDTQSTPQFSPANFMSTKHSEL